MIGEWLGKLKTALNSPLPPDFLLDDELDELEEELPALARVIRAQQAQITGMKQHASKKVWLFALGSAGIVLLVAWMFRYEPMPMPQAGSQKAILLDRWTGNMLVTVPDSDAVWIDAHSFEVHSRKPSQGGQ